MRTLFLHGMAVNLFNPKVILFVLALLPQFVDPAWGSTATQILVLGAVMIVVALISNTTYTMATGTLGAWLKRHPGSDMHRDRASGLVYLMLGPKPRLSPSLVEPRCPRKNDDISAPGLTYSCQLSPAWLSLGCQPGNRSSRVSRRRSAF